jgi:hypothetical protein
MTDYYLMPQLWPESFGVDFDKVKCVASTHKKVKQIALDYEKELNGGVLFSIRKIALKKISLWRVIPIPYSQARDYVNFNDWPCNNN